MPTFAASADSSSSVLQARFLNQFGAQILKPMDALFGRRYATINDSDLLGKFNLVVERRPLPYQLRKTGGFNGFRSSYSP